MINFDIIDANRVFRFWMRCKKYGIDKIMREKMFRHVIETAKKGEHIMIDINGYKAHEINTVISVYKDIICVLNLEHQVKILLVEIPRYSDQDSLYAKRVTDNALTNIGNQYSRGRKLLH